MPGKTLTLDGLEATTSDLSKRSGKAVPCYVMGVIREVPSTSLVERLAAEIDGGNLSGLTVFGVSSLSFLRHFPTLRYLDLRSEAKLDLSPVAALDNLRGLRVDNPGTGLDFRSLPLLEEFIGDWHSKNTGLHQRSMRILRVWGYKPRSQDLREFEALTNLTTISLTRTNLTSLDGVECLEDLRELVVAYAPKLTSLDALSKRSLGIREIELDHLKNVEAYDPLAQLPYLRKLRVSACAPMADLTWLGGHPRLAFFSFVDTNVVTGDLRPLLDAPNLRYVGTLDKRHYSHKSDALNELLAKRHDG